MEIVWQDESQISKPYLAVDQNGTTNMSYFTFTSTNHKNIFTFRLTDISESYHFSYEIKYNLEIPQ